MPWVSIIVWLISFFLSKSQGASSGKAAMIATGAGLATYYLADPANSENVLGFKYPSDGSVQTTTTGTSKTTPGSTGETAPSSGTVVSTTGGLLNTLITEAGSTLKSWGPTGTLGVVAGTAAVTGSSSKNTWIWIALGLGALFLLK